MYMKKNIIIVILGSLCFSNFRVGYDVSKEGDMKFLGQKSSTDFESGFVLAYDLDPKDLGLNFGIEYVFSTEFKNSVEETSIYSIYGTYTTLLNQDMNGFMKIGYSYFDYDFNGSLEELEYLLDIDDIRIDIEGGFMYGFGVNFKQFQFSYTFHTGEMDVTLIDSGDYVSATGDLDITRINLSYYLNTSY